MRPVLILALLITTLFTSPSASLAAPPYPSAEQLRAAYQEAQGDPTIPERAKVENAIQTYFQVRYESLRLGQAVDLDFLAGESAEAQDWLGGARERQAVELALAEAFQLGYQDYHFWLDYESVEIQGTLAQARLYESHAVVFQALAPQESRLGRLAHTLRLQRQPEGWKLVGDAYVDELAFVLAGVPAERLLGRIQARRQVNDPALARPGGPAPRQPPGLRLARYDRAAAAAYAEAWGNWNTDPETWRNPAYHDEPGYDCANFVSQAVYAGAGQVITPPGDYARGWYYDSFSHSGSLPWVRVDAFAAFLRFRRGPGPVGQAVRSACALQPGDVVQLYGLSGWFHEVIVVARQPGGECASGGSLLVNAHTTDLQHYPLSYFSFTALRYLHIQGAVKSPPAPLD
ncbi:MAG: amidase domain-containing protein [Chloroflexota bacterium]